MKRRAVLGSVIGLASVRFTQASANPAIATITVDATRVPTMQAAADRGGDIVLSAGRLPLLAGGVPAGAAHFRKQVSVTGHGTQIAKFSVDGTAAATPFVAGTLSGTHAVDITLGECSP